MEDGDGLVLIGVVNWPKDLEIALNKHWYRMPSRYAPKHKSDYVALYQTHHFGKMGKAISYYARIRDSEFVPRRKLLPDELDHPRVDMIYERLYLGPLKKTPTRIENRSRRRISFGFTTLKRLLESNEISQLFDIPPIEEMMKTAMKENGIESLHEYCLMENGRCRYRLDFAVFCQNGKIAVECDNEKWHQRPRQQARDRKRDIWLEEHSWVVLRFSGTKIKEDLNACIKELKAASYNLGGLAKNSL